MENGKKEKDNAEALRRRGSAENEWEEFRSLKIEARRMR
jgi:hypothetical protein